VTGGLFPETYPTSCAIYSSLRFEADDPDDRAVLLGARDGYIREFLSTATSDDSGDSDTAIDSYVAFGPFQLSDNARVDGVLQNVSVILGESSNDVTAIAYTGRLAEALITSAEAGSGSKFSKTVTSSGLMTGKQKSRGRWGLIVLQNNTSAQTWEIESVQYDTRNIGRLK